MLEDELRRISEKTNQDIHQRKKAAQIQVVANTEPQSSSPTGQNAQQAGQSVYFMPQANMPSEQKKSREEDSQNKLDTHKIVNDLCHQIGALTKSVIDWQQQARTMHDQFAEPKISKFDTMKQTKKKRNNANQKSTGNSSIQAHEGSTNMKRDDLMRIVARGDLFADAKDTEDRVEVTHKRKPEGKDEVVSEAKKRAERDEINKQILAQYQNRLFDPKRAPMVVRTMSSKTDLPEGGKNIDLFKPLIPVQKPESAAVVPLTQLHVEDTTKGTTKSAAELETEKELSLPLFGPSIGKKISFGLPANNAMSKPEDKQTAPEAYPSTGSLFSNIKTHELPVTSENTLFSFKKDDNSSLPPPSGAPVTIFNIKDTSNKDNSTPSLLASFQNQSLPLFSGPDAPKPLTLPTEQPQVAKQPATALFAPQAAPVEAKPAPVTPMFGISQPEAHKPVFGGVNSTTSPLFPKSVATFNTIDQNKSNLQIESTQDAVSTHSNFMVSTNPTNPNPPMSPLRPLFLQPTVVEKVQQSPQKSINEPASPPSQTSNNPFMNHKPPQSVEAAIQGSSTGIFGAQPTIFGFGHNTSAPAPPFGPPSIPNTSIGGTTNPFGVIGGAPSLFGAGGNTASHEQGNIPKPISMPSFSSNIGATQNTGAHNTLFTPAPGGSFTFGTQQAPQGPTQVTSIFGGMQQQNGIPGIAPNGSLFTSSTPFAGVQNQQTTNSFQLFDKKDN